MNLPNIEQENQNVNPGTCVVTNQGHPCSEPPTITKPVPLCLRHQLEIAAAVVPNLLTTALAKAGPAPGPEDDTTLINTSTAVNRPTAAKHDEIVYFITNGGRVKIGFTAGLASRLKTLSLRDSSVLLLLDGGKPLEQALHRRFGPFRVTGTEWFELAPEIIQFIADKRPPQTSVRIPQPRHTQRVKEIQEIRALIEREGLEAVTPTRLLKERGIAKATAFRWIREARDQMPSS